MSALRLHAEGVVVALGEGTLGREDDDLFPAGPDRARREPCSRADGAAVEFTRGEFAGGFGPVLDEAVGFVQLLREGDGGDDECARPGSNHSLDAGAVVWSERDLAWSVEGLLEFGDELNDGINSLLDNNDASVDAATKVVPIISVLGNKHVGAAQVVGPQEAVDRVEAVAQLEQDFLNKLFRVRAMVPIEGDDVKELHRVKGVAVSAMIDVKL